MKVTVTLEASNREEAIKARKLRGIPTEESFLGPTFVDAKNYYIEKQCLYIQTNDAIYIYPLHTVARIKAEN